MSRSKRYIPPSDEELERIRQVREAAEQFDRDRLELMRTALNRSRKADLVELTLRLAQETKRSQWMLEQQIKVNKPVDLLVHDIELAIDTATEVDELRLNYNFDYDWWAYGAVQYGLSQLIQKGHLKEAKSLALKLIRKGSHQMDCSDEGLMQEEIESCLQPVIAAVAESSADCGWALEMIHQDSTGCICRRELTALAEANHRN